MSGSLSTSSYTVFLTFLTFFLNFLVLLLELRRNWLSWSLSATLNYYTGSGILWTAPLVVWMGGRPVGF